MLKKPYYKANLSTIHGQRFHAERIASAQLARSNDLVKPTKKSLRDELAAAVTNTAAMQKHRP